MKLAAIVLFGIGAVGVLNSAGAWGDVACPDPIGPGDAEFQVAAIAGNAVTFPADTDSGAEWATTCLLGWFDRKEFELVSLLPIVSDALLSIMTIDPARFLHAAAGATAGQMRKWMTDAIPFSQRQFEGGCVTPDRFVQARMAIGSLQLTDVREEQLRVAVLHALTGMKCQVVEG